MHRFVLASTSPRRQELLKKIGLHFTVASSEFEEVFDNRPPRVQALYLAQKKVESVFNRVPEYRKALVLGADTCIDLDGRILGKPNNRREARHFLQKMSGRTHRVITALSFWDGVAGSFINETETTLIHLAELLPHEIE